MICKNLLSFVINWVWEVREWESKMVPKFLRNEGKKLDCPHLNTGLSLSLRRERDAKPPK